MTSRELTEWMAYAQVEPFGGERGDLQAGIIASTVANASRDPKRQPKPYEVSQFMPKFTDEPPPSENDVAAKVQGILGGN